MTTKSRLDAREQVKVVATLLNNFSFSPSKFCEEMQLEQRTLQQLFTKLCIHWLLVCDSEDYRVGG